MRGTDRAVASDPGRGDDERDKFCRGKGEKQKRLEIIRTGKGQHRCVKLPIMIEPKRLD